MNPASQTGANPFSLEGVAQYGPATVTCTDLEYFDKAAAELHQYLRVYPDRDSRYGGAIPLRGAHGSGKTHLLSWLAERARTFSTIRAATVYAKADAPSFANLYRQFMAQLEANQLVKIIEQAFVVLAQEIAGRAKVTEGLVARLQNADDVQRLAAERNVDRELLLVELRNRLLVPDIPDQIPLTLLRLLDPVASTAAYRWLAGDEIDGAPSLGLTPSLGARKDGTRLQADQDLACIQALQIIARLHRLADVPFLVCVDQLESMVPIEDSAIRQTVSSLLKKFVEQTGNEDALIFVAGNDDVWPVLSRDVTPRFRRREPIIVGNLNTEEVSALLGAYAHADGMGEFATEARETIRELSGGNPREILRIAHAAWELSGGAITGLSKDVLVQSAYQSGSVADRAQLALAIVDRVFEEVGTPTREIATDSGEAIDRLLVKDDTIRAALILVRATDRLTEISSARRATAARQYCELNWPSAALIIVAIGYSSSEVLSILGTTSRAILFNETSFAGELRGIVLGLPSSQVRDMGAEREQSTALMKRLLEVSERLAEIESRRRDESARVEAEFAERVEGAARPRREAKVLQSRWEMLQALDELSEARERHRPNRERAIVHSLLVSNETYVKAPRIDRIGGMYLDALRLSRILDDDHTEAVRRQLIREFHHEIRPSSWWERMAHNRRAMLTLAGSGVICWLLSAFMPQGLARGLYVGLGIPVDIRAVLRLAGGTAILALFAQLYIYFVSAYVRGRTLSKIAARLKESPYAAAVGSTPFAVRPDFPQSS